ncbi:MAG: hypothetical protein IPK85_20255 [Gemmatimonadetes bacterium]|nr:hypothetical protein [Gemmatimonadota bacterium]
MTTFRIIPLVALTAVVACERATPVTSGTDTGVALARTAAAKDSLIRVKDSLLTEKSRQLSEQSQLLGDAAASARMAAQIEKTLSDVRVARAKGEAPVAESSMPSTAAQLELADRKVKTLIARLNASQARVRRMQTDSVTRASMDSVTLVRLADYERSITELRGTVERQQLEIVALTTRVDSMRRENVVLVARNDTMQMRTNALLAREDSAYIVIATEKELIERGIVRKEGGTKLMFGAGKALVPGRTFDPTVFRVVSKQRDTAIDFPRPDKAYQLVSRHNLQFTNQAAIRDAKVKGPLTITNPEMFWAASKYLIFVERD